MKNEWERKTAASRRHPKRDTTKEDTTAGASTTATASPIPYLAGHLAGQVQHPATTRTPATKEATDRRPRGEV